MTDEKPALPTCADLLQLQAKLSAKCWAERYREALQRVAVVEALLERCKGKPKPGRSDLRAEVPAEDRTNARRWWSAYHSEAGEPWERLFDRRFAPQPWQTPEPWRSAVETLGAQEPPPSLEQIRTVLVRRFGEEARLGDTTLRSILREAGLFVARAAVPPREQVLELSGGGGLALLLAAAQETHALTQMGEAVSKLARAQTAPTKAQPTEPAGRDEEGHFTAAYNRQRLARLSELDLPFFHSVEQSRSVKDMTHLRVRKLWSSRLADHLLCLVALPLVTEQRGVGGLDGPAGAWLEALDIVPYRSKTVEKTLQELKLLGAAEVLWSCHARTWLAVSARWTEGSWRQVALYVDGSNDPWWTRRFALCGKVSRTGRVQPSLQRVIVSAGPGVPVLAQVVAGHCNLGGELFRLLDEVDAAAGPGQVRRITIVDAESFHLDVVCSFAEHPTRDLITVMKGPLARGKEVTPCGPWMPFRQRDQVREGHVVLGTGSNGEELSFRVVEMTRPDSRNVKTVDFITTATKEDLGTLEVPEAYLARWPYQEDLHRRGRDGAGLERSSGYGVQTVANVAVVEKREKAARRLVRATEESFNATQGLTQAEIQLGAAKNRLAARQTSDESLDGRHTLGVRQAKQRLAERKTALTAARRTEKQADEDYAKLKSTPDQIYVRDTALESVATCFKLLLLALLEFINQEYLGGRRITPRTFIEAWVPLPVTIRKSKSRLVYEVAGNPRDPEMTALLKEALEKITQRKLVIAGRQFIARLREDSARSSSS